jgi:hypothetical protein
MGGSQSGYRDRLFSKKIQFQSLAVWLRTNEAMPALLPSRATGRGPRALLQTAAAILPFEA